MLSSLSNYRRTEMKKKTKKLALSRETLRGLVEDKLEDVKGGSGSAILCAGSYCLLASCNSCQTCGSMYC